VQSISDGTDWHVLHRQLQEAALAGRSKKEGGVVILFHFTCCLDTGTILTEGLKPGNNGMSLPPIDVVWLTTGGLECWAIKAPLAMIELVIPSRDRKLVHWGKWVRRHRPEIVECLMNCDCGVDHRPSLKEHYCYFGVIPPSAFRMVYRAKVNSGVVEYEPDFTVLDGGATHGRPNRVGWRHEHV
jgi:hypothetical protein